MTATHYAHRRADDQKQGLHYSHFQPHHARKCLTAQGRGSDDPSKPGANPRRAANGLLSITDRNGNTLSITTTDPTTGGTITQVTSPNGRYIQFTYTNGVITQAVDNIGRTVKYAYDSSGRLQTVTDPNGAVESYGYNSLNQMTTFTDKRGTLATQNTYNANGQVATQTLADGAVWQFSYTTTPTGTQTSVIDPRGYTRQDTFNTAGYLTREIWALGQPQQATYTHQLDAGNRVTLVTDPLSRQTNYTYDNFDDILTVTRLYGTANAVTDTFTYDPTFHQLTSHQDPLGHTTNIGYDSLGNLVSITDPLGDQTAETNNAQGLPTGIRDALGNQTVLSYQQADLASVTNALGSVFNIFTDGVGRPQSITDPLGNITQYTYDPLDRITQSTNAAGGITTLNYDPNGNLHSLTDPRNLGAHINTYDPRNRLHTYTGPVGATETYNYDGLGNLITRIDRKNQTTQISYDPLDRPNVITYADGSTLAITWDAGNRPVTFADTANGAIQRTYDGLDRLLTESGPQGQTTYTYDAASRRSTLSVSGQPASVTYQYDIADRLIQVAQGVAVVGYAYDAANRRTGITLPNGIVGTFKYDNANQLTSISYDGSTHIADATYGYDANGRRTSAGGTLVRPILDSILTGAAYDAGNHLTAVNNGALTYDGNGNLTSMAGSGANTLTWNVRDQVVQTAQGTSLSYDALGRLISRTAGGASTNYLYDGSNQITVNGNLLLRGFGFDDLQAEVTSSGTNSVLVDGLGSIAQLSNGTQATNTWYSYGAYGATASTGSNGVASTVNPFSYPGFPGWTGQQVSDYAQWQAAIANAWAAWNGNLWGTFHEQDGVCTLPGCIGTAANANPAVLACCQAHDACYTTNQCNASSWLGNAAGLAQSCNQCNSQVMQCIGPALAPKLPFFLQQPPPASMAGPTFQ
jgi:YD repeat-containing protein